MSVSCRGIRADLVSNTRAIPSESAHIHLPFRLVVLTIRSRSEHLATSQIDVHRLNLLRGLEGDERTSIIEKLKRCATLHFHDEASDTLILDYWVNEETKKAFRDNFDNSALALFQALQVLLALNLYSVSAALKADLYTSRSHYVSETVPTLASDQRIMRFKYFYFTKEGVPQPMLLKELSDGEHQLLHSLGLCLLFRGTNSLFLLDEPETHFNPDWRANFITHLRESLVCPEGVSQEMLITTHSPFLVSDSTPDKVLVFNRNPDDGKVQITHPSYNTLGASINKITMSEVFGKRETIGGRAQEVLDTTPQPFSIAHNQLLDQNWTRLRPKWQQANQQVGHFHFSGGLWWIERDSNSQPTG